MATPNQVPGCLRQEDDSAMYARRIQITNYGPIDALDIEFPFDDEDRPKPVVLVGENGSGKTLFLSHIVNGLISAKGAVYPVSPEVEQDRVYKLRSPRYIKIGGQYYFARVDYDDGLFVGELQLHNPKTSPPNVPTIDIHEPDAMQLWERMKLGASSAYYSAFKSAFSPPQNQTSEPSQTQRQAPEGIKYRCLLYFPTDRFDDPAWLNTGSLTARAEHVDKVLMEKETPRRIIASATLRANQNWLFDIAYDSRAFEARSVTRAVDPDRVNTTAKELERVPYYRGTATNLYEVANQVMRHIIQRPEARFGIAPRHSRAVSIMSGQWQVVPSIFQLSSGEMALLNLFLSILRDYDLSDAPFSRADDVRGIVVVDEIDLRLHVRYQYEVLPRLIQMFPKVQFIVTTHSPLFVLGMRNTFGDNGFETYRLPDGQKINAEEFSEFGSAYQAFAAISARKPRLLVEGKTDVQYIQAAATRLNRNNLLGQFDLRDVGGDKELGKLWQTLRKVEEGVAGPILQVIVLLHDPEYTEENSDVGRAFRRKMPPQSGHPISKGIENLFDRRTLEQAKGANPTFVDIDERHEATRGGVRITEDEKWSVNPDEKTNLCNWLCENGDERDFQYFEAVFDMLEAVLQEANGGDAPAQE